MLEASRSLKEEKNLKKEKYLNYKRSRVWVLAFKMWNAQLRNVNFFCCWSSNSPLYVRIKNTLLKLYTQIEINLSINRTKASLCWFKEVFFFRNKAKTEACERENCKAISNMSVCRVRDANYVLKIHSASYNNSGEKKKANGRER